MTSVLRPVFGVVVTVALCGCVDQRRATINDAYSRGAISYAEKRRMTTELDERQQAAFDADRRLQDHQPRGDRGAKLVNPQREDDDIYGPNGY